MDWHICIQYPNGKERSLRSCKNREVALKYIDAIYAQGYPMHVAYVVRAVRPIEVFAESPLAINPGLFHSVERLVSTG